MPTPELATPGQISTLNRVAELAVRDSKPDRRVRGVTLKVLNGNAGEHVQVAVEKGRVFVNHHESDSEHSAVVTDRGDPANVMAYAGTGKHSTPPRGGETDPNAQIFTAEAAQHLIDKVSETAQL